MTTSDGLHIKTVRPGEEYALQQLQHHAGRANRTNDEIDDDIDGSWMEWVSVATYRTFAEALNAREIFAAGFPLPEPRSYAKDDVGPKTVKPLNLGGARAAQPVGFTPARGPHWDW